jgi:hypothetical protein
MHGAPALRAPARPLLLPPCGPPTHAALRARHPTPYQVLGIPRDADTNAINRAYTAKKFAVRGDDAATARIEGAHSKIMMGSLSARLKVRLR